MTTMHEFAPHSCHNADDDLPRGYKTLELKYNPFICFENSKSFMVELWWRNSVLLYKQTLCKSGVRATTQTYFFRRRGLGCLEVAIKKLFMQNIRDIDKCKDFGMLKVEVPIIFF
jgi:hypothetical protein